MIANTPEAWSERAEIADPWSAALWSEAGQTQRFLAVLRHLDLRDGDTLLDYGAGTGRFCEFLPLTVTYYAYDTAPGMRERVRREHPRAWVLDEMPDMAFDHIVCIGTFNLRDGWSKRQTWDCLDDLWQTGTRTLAVSFYRGDDKECLSYTPLEILEFADSCTDFFTFDCSFLANDALLLLR